MVPSTLAEDHFSHLTIIIHICLILTFRYVCTSPLPLSNIIISISSYLPTYLHTYIHRSPGLSVVQSSRSQGRSPFQIIPWHQERQVRPSYLHTYIHTYTKTYPPTYLTYLHTYPHTPIPTYSSLLLQEHLEQQQVVGSSFRLRCLSLVRDRAQMLIGGWAALALASLGLRRLLGPRGSLSQTGGR